MIPTPEALAVFGIVAAMVILFATRWIPVAVTALCVPVALAVLEPWTGVTAAEAVSGFASPATLTVAAMFVLTEALRRTGALRRMGRLLVRLSRGRESRQLAMTVGLGGLPAGFVNNTPLVGVLVPLLVDLARRTRTSPSRLLIPLSYAAMLGGTLSILGSSANLLVSDLSRRLLGRPIGVFEITPLGVVVLGVGALYVLVAGRRLLPERIHPDLDLLGRFELDDFLHRLQVEPGSPLVGRTLEEAQRGERWELDVLQIRRGRTVYAGPRTDQTVATGDVLRVRAHPETAAEFARRKRLRPLRRARFTDATLVEAEHTVLELTVAPDSDLVGRTLVSSAFRNRFEGTVLGLGRGDHLVRDGLEEVELRAGDSLLVLLPLDKRAVIERGGDLVVTRVTPMEDLLESDAEEMDPGAGRIAIATAVLAGVVAVAGLEWLPIHVAALGGVVLVVVSGCVDTEGAYAAVEWDVVVVLAGLIPLGLAVERSGAAAALAELLLGVSGELPHVGALGLVYLTTALLANVIGSQAAVAVSVPVGIEVAAGLGADPFAFVLAVLFAAAVVLLSPVAYATNLMVLGPGGYRLGDYARVGAPLQILLALVVPTGIVLIWGM